MADSCSDLQRMEPSNVSGGYWQQLPAPMQRRWPFKERTKVELECEDFSRKHSALKQENGLTTWQYQVPTLIEISSEFLETQHMSQHAALLTHSPVNT